MSPSPLPHRWLLLLRPVGRPVLAALPACVVAVGCNLFAQPCDDDNPCDQGVCIEGLCAPDGDPNQDAGAPDDDAGRPTDGGEYDDAGRGDAGSRDAGAGDGGPADAGFDAGPQPSWASTMNSAGAIASPTWGDSTGLNLVAVGNSYPTPDLSDPRRGLLLDAQFEGLTLPQVASGTTNFDVRVGTASFWLYPLFDQNDGLNHYFVYLDDGVDTAVVMRKAAANNSNHLQIQIIDRSNGLFELDVANYTLAKQVWQHLVFTWDTTSSPAALRAWLDQTELVATPLGLTTFAPAAPSTSGFVHIGQRDATFDNTANFVIDDLELWTELRPPSTGS